MKDNLSYRVNNSDNEDEDMPSQKEVIKILREIQDGQKAIIVLTPEEIKELREWLSDKKALGRAWAIAKTGLISTAGIILAWNVFFDNVIRNAFNAISNFFGFGSGH